MIYLISDIHGDINFKGLNDYLNVATDDDLLIVLGDICLNFEKTIENEEFTKFFLSINKNVAFIDGNHENFEYLNRFPIEDWNGGKVRRLSNYVVYMQRGSIYTINKLTFFTFGGCKSSAKWKEMGLYYQGETATEQQYNFAIKNLKKSNLRVDYILTHKYEIGTSTDLLDVYLNDLSIFIEKNVSYKKWYYGHLHYKAVDEKHECIYNELTSLE